MKPFNHHAIGLCQGASLLFSAFENHDPMWSGEGPRAIRQTGFFDEAFAAPPAVHARRSPRRRHVGHRPQRQPKGRYPGGQDHPVRLRHRFPDLGDTRVARIRAEWLALGALPHKDRLRG
ncbi:hypothetical protein [Paracoccus sp. S3-43]|uniref:hypothetical protein n=1 Tax=Paracoccus sp. S3-43 TaxID=3030011 RepID=UPI0023AFEB0D|nr:hypothetical protein [Paracoccus sp. S3-43]WEF22923.1 hypothetical protein PXD02_08665 [Paracoccus sp. S3-43]